MKRRAFLKGLTAFLAAPLAVFGVKKLHPKPALYLLGEQTIETDGGFGLPPIKAEGAKISYDPSALWVAPRFEKSARAILNSKG